MTTDNDDPSAADPAVAIIDEITKPGEPTLQGLKEGLGMLRIVNRAPPPDATVEGSRALLQQEASLRDQLAEADDRVATYRQVIAEMEKQLALQERKREEISAALVGVVRNRTELDVYWIRRKTP